MQNPTLLAAIFTKLSKEFPSSPSIDHRNGYQISYCTSSIFIDEDGVFNLIEEYTCENQYGSSYDAGYRVWKSNFLPSNRLFKYIANVRFIEDFMENTWWLEVNEHYITK